MGGERGRHSRRTRSTRDHPYLLAWLMWPEFHAQPYNRIKLINARRGGCMALRRLPPDQSGCMALAPATTQTDLGYYLVVATWVQQVKSAHQQLLLARLSPCVGLSPTPLDY